MALPMARGPLCICIAPRRRRGWKRSESEVVSLVVVVVASSGVAAGCPPVVVQWSVPGLSWCVWRLEVRGLAVAVRASPGAGCGRHNFREYVKLWAFWRGWSCVAWIVPVLVVFGGVGGLNGGVWPWGCVPGP